MSLTSFRSALCTLLCVIACNAGAQPIRADRQGEPLLLVIHGRNQAFRISGVLREEWFAALDDGLAKIGARGLIPDYDRRFVYYANVYEHGSVAAPPCPSGVTGLPYTRPQLSILVGAIAQYLSTGDRNDAVGRMRGIVEDALRSPDILALQLPDVKRYKKNASTRCETERVLSAILDSASLQRRPVVIAAHSMGSLITFRVLGQRRQECNRLSADSATNVNREDLVAPVQCGPVIARFISFGSQLGARGMPSWLLGKEWNASAPQFPKWVNVVGRDDPLAFPVRNRKELLPIADTLVDLYVPTKARDQHWFGGYLKNPDVARSIARGWCDASARTSRCEVIFDADSAVSRPFPQSKLIIVVPYAAIGESSADMGYMSGGLLVRTTLLPALIRVDVPFMGFRDTTRSNSVHLGRIYALLPFDVQLVNAEDRETGIRANLTTGITVGAGRVYRSAAHHPEMAYPFVGAWTVGPNYRMSVGPLAFMGDYSWAGGFTRRARRTFREPGRFTMAFTLTSAYLRY